MTAVLLSHQRGGNFSVPSLIYLSAALLGVRGIEVTGVSISYAARTTLCAPSLAASLRRCLEIMTASPLTERRFAAD